MINSSKFFQFLVERENIRLRKAAGQKPPYTDDVILQSYKFTNVYRKYDRTSMELIKNFYEPNCHNDRRTILMNAALFRYFGTYEFANVVGWQTYDDFDFNGIKCIAKERLARKQRVFTGAYVITNQGIKAPKQDVVVDYFLRDLHAATPKLIEVVEKNNCWENLSDEMRKINGFGGTGFMTKEILLDTMYTRFWSKNERGVENMSVKTSIPDDYNSWTPIGPGARRGISRLLGNDDPDAVKINEHNCLHHIRWLHTSHKDHWPDDWEKLAPTDIQFQLCEFDKYERVRLGQGRPRSRYNPQ